MSSRAYHQQELHIAQSPADPRHVMPVFLPQHRRILDVGCGAGQTLLAGDLPAGALAIGLDPDEEALALGREWSRSIHFTAGRAEQLPFAAASFDLVLARVALPWTHIPAALAEMARVTRPGGDLWLVLHSFHKTWRDLADNLHRGQWKRATYRAYVLGNGTLFHLSGQLLGAPFPPRGRVESFQTAARMKRELQAAGFGQARSTATPHFVVTARRGEML